MFRRTTRRIPRTRGPARPPLRLQPLEDRTVPSTFAWKVDASGNWNSPSNWLLVSGTAGAGYPNAVGDSALLGAAITASRTVTIPDGVTIAVGNLQIDDNNSYTIAAAGTGRLIFDNTGTSDAVLRVD